MGCYLAQVAGGHLTLLEHSAAKWLGAADIDSVDWLPADITIIDQLKSRGVVR